MSWRYVRLKRLFERTWGGSWGEEPNGEGFEMSCIRGTDFDFGRLRASILRAPVRKFTELDVKYRSLRSGDLIIEKSGGGEQQPVGRAVLYSHAEPAIPTNFAAGMRPVSGSDGRFLTYLLASQYSSGVTRSSIKQTTGIQNLDLEDFLATKVLVVEGSTQRAIADFLDAETARIDSVIRLRSKAVELLDGRRLALQASAVTLGFGPGPTVRTGNMFAPEIAFGWRVLRLRHVLTEIVDTEHKTAPVVDAGGYLVVRTTNVRRGALTLEGARYTDLETWQEWTSRGVPQPGDVIFTREAPAGEACTVPAEVPLCLGQRTVLLRPQKDLVLGEWLVKAIYAGAARQFIDVLSRSTTVSHINMSDIPDIPVVVPSLAEQVRCLDLLERAQKPFTNLATSFGRQIALLQERKQALITAAVTGQIDLARDIAEEAS